METQQTGINARGEMAAGGEAVRRSIAIASKTAGGDAWRLVAAAEEGWLMVIGREAVINRNNRKKIMAKSIKRQ
jgi:hypothetical protein